MAGAAPEQTQEDLVPPAPAAIGFRLSGVLLAPAVAAVVHLVLAGPVGLDLQIPEGPGSATLRELDLLTTVVVTLVLGLAGWVLVTVLERWLGGQRGRRIWTFVAVAVFVVSIPPIAALDVSPAVQWGLFALHLTVAAVLLPTLANGRPAAHPVAGGWVEAHAEAAAAQESTHDEAQHDHAAH